MLGLGVTGTEAQAFSLRLKHKPFKVMTRQEKVDYLKAQIHKDRCVIRFWKHHTHIKGITQKEIHWSKVSLRISTRNLHKFDERTHGAYIPQLICSVFGPNCSMALKVAQRESGFCTCAVNGQYLGIFQMGTSERAKFATIGYTTAYQQIIAAHNYFLVSGWSPWSQTAY